MNRNITKQKILDAALLLFSKKGYIGATTRVIALEAGVREITLFRHFGSKEKLFEEVLNRYTFLPELKGLLPELEGLPYEQALKLVGIRFFQTLKKRRSLVRIMVCDINIYPEKIKELYTRFLDDLIQTLAHYFVLMQKKKQLRTFSHETGARAFLGMIFSYFLKEEMISETSVAHHGIEEMIGEFVDIFVKGTIKE